MTDDSFVFDDDEEHTDDEELFGTHSDDSTAETDRRFGTSATDDTDPRIISDRLRAVASGGTATVAVALVLVVVLGVVAYPFVMGAFETTDGSNRMIEGRGGGSTAVTVASETATTTITSRTTTQTTTGRTDTTTASPTTNAVPTPTPTSTPTPTPTPVPERGFPAGTPVGTNETDDTAESRAGLSFDSVGGGAGSKHVHESPRVPSGTGSRLGSQQASETGVRTPRGRFPTHH